MGRWIEHGAVDELHLWGAVAVAAPGEIRGLGLLFVHQQSCSLKVEVGTVDLGHGFDVPRVGLGLGDLPPAPHLGEKPHGVRVVGVGGEVAEEDVEVGNRARVTLLVLEGPGHRLGDHLGLGTDIFRPGQDLYRL